MKCPNCNRELNIRFNRAGKYNFVVCKCGYEKKAAEKVDLKKLVLVDSRTSSQTNRRPSRFEYTSQPPVKAVDTEKPRKIVKLPALKSVPPMMKRKESLSKNEFFDLNETDTSRAQKYFTCPICDTRNSVPNAKFAECQKCHQRFRVHKTLLSSLSPMKGYQVRIEYGSV